MSCKFTTFSCFYLSTLALVLLFSACKANEKNMNPPAESDMRTTDVIGLAQKNKGIIVQVEGDSLLKHPISEPDKNLPYFHLTKDLMDNNIFYTDTVIANNPTELLALIQSNRLIRLLDKDYEIPSTLNLAFEGNKKRYQNEGMDALRIEGIKNLKIVGKKSTKILAQEKSAIPLKIENSYNIDIESLSIGFTKVTNEITDHGILRIGYSYNLNFSDTKLLGPTTIGLNTYAVFNLNFNRVEISKSSILAFELGRSRKVNFDDSKIHENNPKTSVLGAFTNNSQEISFTNCNFLDNLPMVEGNPFFNYFDNKNPTLFSNCTFSNNVGFNWDSDYMRIIDCKIDSSDFFGLTR